jgi:predicted unusual protein kinase regulating ubiquinone biosynthesis (AarF/ABC1/UbiB family)
MLHRNFALASGRNPSHSTMHSLSHKQQTDRHAGNLLACPDGRLCYLDFGMMSYADTNQRNGFLLAVVVRYTVVVRLGGGI